MEILSKLSSISIKISFDNILVGIFILYAIYVIGKKIVRYINGKYEIVNLNIGIAQIGSIEIKKTKNVKKLAHKAWVEIMTRKAGIPFDEKNDVIVEVYDSWYALFKALRNILEDVEPERDESVLQLEEILLKILNDGMRPHLTRWQAKYRRWYNKELDKKENENLPPQEIQKKYKEYTELVEDMMNTNKLLAQFAKELRKLI